MQRWHSSRSEISAAQCFNCKLALHVQLCFSPNATPFIIMHSVAGWRAPLFWRWRGGDLRQHRQRRSQIPPIPLDRVHLHHEEGESDCPRLPACLPAGQLAIGRELLVPSEIIHQISASAQESRQATGRGRQGLRGGEVAEILQAHQLGVGQTARQGDQTYVRPEHCESMRAFVLLLRMTRKPIHVFAEEPRRRVELRWGIHCREAALLVCQGQARHHRGWPAALH